MKKYIVSIDLGSTNVKTIVMKIEDETATFIDSYIFLSQTNELNEQNIINFLYKNNIDLNKIEKIILVGSGSSFYDNKYIGIDCIKIDEFSAIGLGGVILSKSNEAIVVNVGTGTSIVYSDINNNKYLIGTGLGGGTFYGLNKKIGINFENTNEIYKKAENGDYHNVDLLIGDISKNNISILSKDITAANFAAVWKNSNEDDIVSAILNIITQNIGLIVKLVKENYCLKNNKSNINIVFSGSFIKNNIVKKYFKEIEDFTKEKYIFLSDDYIQFSTAIGAYEYYLIKMREA